MDSGSRKPARPITEFLLADHQRLEGLLQLAVARIDQVDRQIYDQFRAGLLRHIGMEEKILLPAAQRLRGGNPLPMASKLRLDHGAIAALLMPTPTAAIVAKLRQILKHHNGVEEGAGGLYDLCDELAGPESSELLAKLQAAGEITVMPTNDSPAVLNAVGRSVERAGYDFD
jgi:Hemerythrin HHE cation binding domain